MDPGQWVIVGLALAFTVTLGLHDTSNAVATSIASRALTPRVAVVMAAVANLVGAAIGYLSPGITLAETVGTGLVRPDVDAGPAAVGALVGAIAWNLATWWRGMPSSSSHALLGGLLGGALASMTRAQEAATPFSFQTVIDRAGRTVREAIAVLTEAGRLRRDVLRPVDVPADGSLRDVRWEVDPTRSEQADWAEFVTLALAGAAAIASCSRRRSAVTRS